MSHEHHARSLDGGRRCLLTAAAVLIVAMLLSFGVPGTFAAAAQDPSPAQGTTDEGMAAPGGAAPPPAGMQGGGADSASAAASPAASAQGSAAPPAHRGFVAPIIWLIAIGLIILVTIYRVRREREVRRQRSTDFKERLKQDDYHRS